MRLDAVRLGFAVAIVWALGVLFLGATAAWLDWGTPLVKLGGSLYLGYAPTLPGALIGTIWALVDGFIGGVLVAWIYNGLPFGQTD